MTDLDLLNAELRAARKRYERELRSVVEDSSVTLAAAAGIVDTDATTAAAEQEPTDDGFLSPIERVAYNISRIVRRGQEAVALAAARGLATTRAIEWYDRHKARLDQQATRAGYDAARIIQGWVQAKQIVKIGADGRDAYSIARSAESVGAGGPSSLHTDGTVTGAKPWSVMDDTEFRAMIMDEGSAAPLYRWEHGMAPNPFTPHVQLDGVTWSMENELEVLANPSDFPRAASYFPGDHNGCTCRYDVEFVRIT